MTGTPGTGKTTFAKMLAREMSAIYISLGKYVSEHRLFSGVDSKRRVKVVDPNRARDWINRLIRSDDALIVDTHHPEGIIPKGATKLVFVLRCDPTVLARRLQRKKWVQQKIRENVTAEMLDYCYIKARSYYGRGKVVQLDTTYSSVKHSVGTAKNVISGRKPPSLRVDWLRKIEKNKMFLRYLGC